MRILFADVVFIGVGMFAILYYAWILVEVVRIKDLREEGIDGGYYEIVYRSGIEKFERKVWRVRFCVIIFGLFSSGFV